MEKNIEEFSTEIEELIDNFSVENMDTPNTNDAEHSVIDTVDSDCTVADYDTMSWNQLYYTIGGGGGGSSGAAGDILYFGGSADTISLTTTGSTYNITMPYPHGSDFVFNSAYEYDDRIAELTKLESELEEEARLRQEHPAVDELYQQYRLALALVAEKDCDQYFEDRMRAFGGKVEEE